MTKKKRGRPRKKDTPAEPVVGFIELSTKESFTAEEIAVILRWEACKRQL